MTSRVCPYCEESKLVGRRVQCGAPDCAREHHNKRNRDWHRQYREKTGTHYNYSMPSRPKRKSNPHCVDCGKPVGWGKTQDTRCREHSRKYSYRVKAEAARKEHQQQRYEYNSRRARAQRKALRSEAGVSANPRWPFASGQCHRCGEWFTCRVTNSPPQYCSKKCSSSTAKELRRSREAGVVILPAQRWKTYKRDDYTCKLCGILVDRKAAPGADLEPTLDHKIPLSLGGAHVPANWQTAHRLCNSLKSDRLDWTFGESAWLIRECLETSEKLAEPCGTRSFLISS